MIRKTFAVLLLIVSTAGAQIMGPKISFQKTEHDFGDIVQGEKVSHKFMVTNTGGDLLVIANVRASCGCTAALPDKRELSPGESTNIKVEFNSTGRLARQVKTVTVSSNDKENPEVRLTIRCNIIKPGDTQSSNTPKIFFQETQHNFGKVPEGVVVDYEFKFVNKGSSTLNIKDIKTSCGCTGTLLSEKQIEPGKEGTLKVALNTANRMGKLSRSITVISDDPNEPNKLLTVSAEIYKEASN
jgi:hypothetical protein